MKVSIILPAFNEERLLGQTLQKVRESAETFAQIGWESEIIVCDNNSTDRTPEIARQYGAQVVFEPINQISRARNRGASAASGDWLLFIDADSQPSPGLFFEMVDQIKCGSCLAGGSTILFDHESVAGARLRRFWNWVSRRFRFLAGSFIFCDAAAFREIGGFSVDLFASEELDLTKRLKRAARRSGKQIVILHQHPLLTSGRKLQLYQPREIIWFTAKTILTAGKTLRSRKSCNVWYDGRR